MSHPTPLSPLLQLFSLPSIYLLFFLLSFHSDFNQEEKIGKKNQGKKEKETPSKYNERTIVAAISNNPRNKTKIHKHMDANPPPPNQPDSLPPPPPPSTQKEQPSQPESAPPSRYESQKRRDWNTFLQYLKNHKPPLTLARSSGAHVIEFLKYLDQFGKTKVHVAGCGYFGDPSPPGPCGCPLKQAWGSLDALIGRLRAAYEENGGRPESNPFGARAVRIYLREVREGQAKARGIPYEKKKRKRVEAAGASSASVVPAAQGSDRDEAGGGATQSPAAGVASSSGGGGGEGSIGTSTTSTPTSTVASSSV